MRMLDVRGGKRRYTRAALWWEVSIFSVRQHERRLSFNQAPFHDSIQHVKMLERGAQRGE